MDTVATDDRSIGRTHEWDGVEIMWTTTVVGDDRKLIEGLAYAGGRLDERGPGEWRQDQVWTFGLAWHALHRLQVSQSTISETFSEWERSGRIAYQSRGRARWIAAETRKGTTGVLMRAMPADIGDGDVLVMADDPVPSFVAVDRVTRTSQDGFPVLRAHGTVIVPAFRYLASEAPSTTVEMTTLYDLLAPAEGDGPAHLAPAGGHPLCGAKVATTQVGNVPAKRGHYCPRCDLVAQMQEAPSTTVDMAPDVPVEVTTRGAALDRVWS